MWGSIIGGLLGGIGSMFGADKAASASMKGARMQMKMTKWASRKNLQWQKRFAQRGIRWRVKDAKKAGLHPLAALGAQIPGFAPSFQVGNAGDIIASGGANAGSLYAQAGQDIGRAVAAMDTPDGKNAAYTQAVQGLHLENLALQNQALASQIAKQNQPGGSIPLPVAAQRYAVDGQGNTVKGPLVVDKPLERVVAAGVAGNIEPGTVTDVGTLAVPGGQATVMSKDAKDRLEEDTLGTLQWSMRNRLLGPLLEAEKYAPPSMQSIPAGYMRVYNPVTGIWSVAKDPNYGRSKDGDFRY